MFGAILVFAFFATVFPIGKASMAYAQPIFLTGCRMVLAGILLLLYHWGRGNRVVLRPMLVAQLFVITVCNIYLTNVCEFWGLQYLSAAKTSFIYNLSPFVSALLSYFLFHEIMTIRKWIGLVIGFLGFLPILLSSSAAEEAVGGVAFLSWPTIALITAATATVIGWVMMRVVVQNGVSVLYANGISMLLGGIGAFITSYMVENWDPAPYTNFWYFLGYMLVLMLISNILCYNLYAHLLKTYTATFLTFVGFTSPLWAALYGWLFLDETVGPHFFISCMAVFSGLSIFYLEEIRLGYVHTD